MTKPLDPLTVQRLAYVRFLYQQGLEHTRRPAPLSSSALLSFHDAVENFLGLTAEHLGVEVKPAITFMEYWGAIKPARELPGKASMKRLNDARVSLKHHGNFPSVPTLERARDAVVEFFTSTAPDVFGVAFDEIDMVGLVPQEETARLLREVKTHADIGDYGHALGGLAVAFEALLYHYAGALHSWDWKETPFSFGPRLGSDDYRADAFTRKGDFPHALEKTMKVATETQKALRIMGLGISFPEYARFAALTPSVSRAANGQISFMIPTGELAPTAEAYEWASHFVIESALRAANADEVLRISEAHWHAVDSRSLNVEWRDWNGAAPADDGS
jgi:hypothetical protein